MKFTLLSFLLALSMTAGAQTSNLFLFDTGNAAIPDHDANGYQDSRDLTGLSGVISDVNVTLSISGGFNGDLYAWLSHGTGVSILLNRVGRSSLSGVGYANAGFGLDDQLTRFLLDDQASRDVHFYQTGPYALNAGGQLTGTWQPDGRILDPESPASLFDTASRSTGLGVFNGMDPNGAWTLFVADVSSGNISTLTGWGLQVTWTPEPSTFALIALGAAALAISHRRR